MAAQNRNIIEMEKHGPPSTYEKNQFQDNTATDRKRSEPKPTGNHQSSITLSPINGFKKGVMSSGSHPVNMPPSTSVPEPNINLSREELLKLLSVFEGELQARDEVIEILKAERPNNQAMQERYGVSNMPLQALQRDAASLDISTNDHVEEQTTQNLQKIISNQKESYKRLKRALLGAEQVNQRLEMEINEEKKKHQDYMIKSDDFVNLLEDERERLKIALEREKEISERREYNMEQKRKGNKDELAKLKSLSLVLVEERKQQIAELAEHKNIITGLERRLKEAEIKCKESENDINVEKDHAVQLENDLEEQSKQFFRNQDELNLKLQEEVEKNMKLEDKVKTITQQLKKLKTVQRNLQKTDDQLCRIHDKLEKDEEHDLLLEEVELLRQRVKDMEESEKIYTQAQEDCKEIKQKLETEIQLTRNLRSQLKSIQTQVKAQKDLQRSIEDTDFRFEELQSKFEFEKRKSNDMKEQLQKMKSRMSELDQYEAILQETQQKMNKMKEKIILLTSEKKCCDDQVQFLIEKNQQSKDEAKREKEKVTDLTGKFISESKKVLKLREQLGQEKQKYSSQIAPLKEKLRSSEETIKELSSTKQTQAEEANDRLRRQVIMLKSCLDKLEGENKEKDAKLKSLAKLPKEALSQPVDLLDVIQKLHKAESRCEHLSEQLHAKSKLCEDLKKKVTLASQANNNSSVKTDSKISSSSPFAAKTLSPSKSESKPVVKSISETETNRASSIQKNPAPAQFTPPKVNVGACTQLPTSKTTGFLPVTKKNPAPTQTSLTRSSKVAPVNFRVPKRPPSVSRKPLETNPTPKEASSVVEKDCTENKTKNGQNETLVVKTAKKKVEAGSERAPSKNTGCEKRLDVPHQDSKIPKQRHFRTQAQKDFAKLQEKWASKLGK